MLRAGERTGRLGLLLSGSVHVIREDFWGGRTIVGIVEAGDVFAESFALAGEPLEVSVFSPGEAEVLFLDAEAAGVYSGRFTVNLLALMAGKNLALTRKMGHMARKTTREKLLSYLTGAEKAPAQIFILERGHRASSKRAKRFLRARLLHDYTVFELRHAPFGIGKYQCHRYPG